MFWNDMRSSSSNFNYLKIFDVSHVHGSESELKFIAYIYKITPMLEVSNIKINWKNIPFGKDEMGNILIELLSFKRASGAKVIIQKPLD
ncbi:hypothetical protein ZOSMA_516G00010 [Zostera marina]|uniref:FBD domain-containing protein n=1 Tax=Zostera marina TaxID=29655 RepID=A0A0K9NXZ1_ZOSMR|nr:hypothetical protein ZOSMA_516G00010 [Zostera marina]